MDSIIAVVNSLFEEYTIALVNEFEIDMGKCEEILAKILKKEDLIKKESPKKDSSKKEIKKEAPKKKNDEEPLKKGGGVCMYVYTRKPKEGEQCGCKVKDGGDYCSKHKETEGKEKKEKNVIPKVSPKKEEKVVKKDKESPQKEAIIRKPTFRINLDIKKHVHEDSGMVLKSAAEKKIIGKLHDKQIIDLTQDDIEICRKWSFKIDESQLEKLNKVKKDDDCEEESHPVLNKILIKNTWTDGNASIKGRITKDKLEEFVNKKIKKGECSEEFDDEGYPITLTVDKKSKKLVVKYQDGEGDSQTVNITVGEDEDLQSLFKYLKDMSTNEDENEDKTKKVMKALMSDKSEDDDQAEDEDVSEKSKKRNIIRDEDEDIEDILDEVEKEDEEDILEDEEDDEMKPWIDDLIKPLKKGNPDGFFEYLEEVEADHDHDHAWRVDLFKMKGSDGKTIVEVAREKKYTKVLKHIKQIYLSDLKL